MHQGVEQVMLLQPERSLEKGSTDLCISFPVAAAGTFITASLTSWASRLTGSSECRMYICS